MILFCILFIFFYSKYLVINNISTRKKSIQIIFKLTNYLKQERLLIIYNFIYNIKKLNKKLNRFVLFNSKLSSKGKNMLNSKCYLNLYTILNTNHSQNTEIDVIKIKFIRKSKKLVAITDRSPCCVENQILKKADRNII